MRRPTVIEKWSPYQVALFEGAISIHGKVGWAQQYFECTAISFAYGQRHSSELDAAKRIAAASDVPHRVIDIDIGQLGGSSLTDMNLDIPHGDIDSLQNISDIPSTYVPARNTIFLSYALALAEVTDAQHIVIGVNAVDYSGYPDCRPEYITAFEKMANLATKASTQGSALTIETPLIELSKAQIIELGSQLGVDYAQTVSCYQANTQGYACGRCDSCLLRKQGFSQAGIADPTKYQ